MPFLYAILLMFVTHWIQPNAVMPSDIETYTQEGLNLEQQRTGTGTPMEIFPRSICDDIIYGIDFRMDDAFQVMSVKMYLDE